MNEKNVLAEIKKELADLSNKDKIKGQAKFFQTHPGGYGEGDKFIGVSVPDQRKISRKYFKTINLDEITELLTSEIHEYRLTALFLMVLKYEKSKSLEEQKELVKIYSDNIKFINNWDLVDSSALQILGAYLWDKDRKILYDFAVSDNMWVNRISIISTFYFIKHKDFEDTLKLAEILLTHKHDLIHKAVGWMIREVGNRDYETAYNFVKKHYSKMPRTMLRYAIEKYDEDVRLKFLKNQI
jgi:3-methyladenine DNA glycosylase AlkD